MIRKIVAVSILLILIFAQSVIAQKASKKDTFQPDTGSLHEEPESIQNFQFTQENLNLIKSGWNSNLKDLRKQVPSFILGLVATQRIEILIDNTTVGIVMNNAVMEDIISGAIDNPSLRISTSSETFDMLMKSDTPLKDLDAALKDKRLRYEALTFSNKIKMFFGRFAVRIFA